MLLCEKTQILTSDVYKHWPEGCWGTVSELPQYREPHFFPCPPSYVFSTYRRQLFYNSDRRSKRDITVPRNLKMMKTLPTLYIFLHFRVQF